MAKKKSTARPIKLQKNLSVREIATGVWEMRIQKPDKKRRLYGTLPEVTAEAVEYYASLTSGMTTNPTIPEALEAALFAGNSNEETLERYTREANKFQEWFQVTYPAVMYWKNVRLSMVQAYVDKLAREKKAPDTIRLAVFPVRKASLLWHSDYPRIFDHVTMKLKLPKDDGREPHALSMEQIQAVLAYLREQYPNLYPLIALAGYSGMRLREASGILNSDVDLKAGTLSIEPNHIRPLKNAKSRRTIPLTAGALDVIKHHLETAAVKTFLPGDPVFLDARGEPWTNYRLGQECRNAKIAMCRKLQLPAFIKLRNMRATFHTMAIKAGVREIYADKYQGRQANSVSRKSYLQIDTEDLRREVVAVYDAAVASGLHQGCTADAMQPYTSTATHATMQP